MALRSFMPGGALSRSASTVTQVASRFLSRGNSTEASSKTKEDLARLNATGDHCGTVYNQSTGKPLYGKEAEAYLAQEAAKQASQPPKESFGNLPPSFEYDFMKS